MINLEEINDLKNELQNKDSVEFEKCVEKSFNCLGFKTRWLPDENDNNPDVILEAWNCINKYIVTIECYASITESGKASREKVSQIRANGPRFIKNPDYIGKKLNLHLCVLSRGGFQEAAIRSSSPDVSLLSIQILLDLLSDLSKGLNYSQHELEKLFRGFGLKDNILESLRFPKLNHLVNLGLICCIVENNFLYENVPIEINDLIGQILALSRHQGINLTRNEIEKDILLLSHPTVGLLNFKGDYIIYPNTKREINYIKLGLIGNQVYNYYKYWKKKLKPLKLDAEWIGSRF